MTSEAVDALELSRDARRLQCSGDLCLLVDREQRVLLDSDHQGGFQPGSFKQVFWITVRT